MWVLKYINVWVFLVSLSLGILAVYLFDDQRTIYVFPDEVEGEEGEEDGRKLLYRDHADNCFQFRAKEVSCPSDEASIFTVPAQS